MPVYNYEVFDIRKEDGGCAVIATIGDDSENEVFFRIQSWDDTCEHKELHALGLKEGQKVKITLEIENG